MTDYVNCGAGDLLRGMDRYRATWAETGTGATVFNWLTGRGLPENLTYLFDDGIVATGLAIAISHPTMAPGNAAGTIDLQIHAAPPVGATVGRLATALTEQATLGRNLELTRLERYGAGAGPAADAAGRQSATDAGNQVAAASGLSGLAQDVGSGITKVVHTVVLLALVGGGLYLFVTMRGRRMDW